MSDEVIGLSVDLIEAVKQLTSFGTVVGGVNKQLLNFKAVTAKTDEFGNLIAASFKTATDAGKEVVATFKRVADANSETGTSMKATGVQIKQLKQNWDEQVNSARAALAASLEFTKGQGGNFDQLVAKHKKLALSYEDVINKFKEKIPIKDQKVQITAEIKGLEGQVEIFKAPAERAKVAQFVTETQAKLNTLEAKFVNREKEKAKLEKLIADAKVKLDNLSPELFAEKGEGLTQKINKWQAQLSRLKLVDTTAEEIKLQKLLDDYQARLHKLDLIDPVKEKNRLEAVIAQAKKDLEFDFDDKKVAKKLKSTIKNAERDLKNLDLINQQNLDEAQAKLERARNTLAKLNAPTSLEQLLGAGPKELLAFDAAKLSAFEKAEDELVRQTAILQNKGQSVVAVFEQFGQTGVKSVQHLSVEQNKLLVLLGKVYDILGNTTDKLNKEKAARQATIESLFKPTAILGTSGGFLDIPHEARYQQGLAARNISPTPQIGEDEKIAAQRKIIYDDVAKYLLLANNKEVAAVKAAQAEISKYLIQNSEIGKKEIEELFRAAEKGTVGTLHQSVQGLLPLIQNLSFANRDLGKAAQETSIKSAQEERAHQQALAHTLASEREYQEQLKKRQQYAQDIIDRAKATTDTSGLDLTKYGPQIRQVNNQLLAVVNQANKLIDPLEHIDELFAAAKDNRPFASAVPEAVALYSALATLYGSYDKLTIKIKESDKSAAEAARNAVKALAQNYLTKEFPSVAAATPVDEFKGKEIAVRNYHRALLLLNETLNRVDASKAILDEAKQLIIDPSSQGSAEAKALAKSLLSASSALTKLQEGGKKKIVVDVALKLSNFESALNSIIGTPNFAGVEEKYRQKFLKMKEAAAQAYAKSEATPSDLIGIVRKVEDPLTRYDAVPKFRSLDIAVRKVFESVDDLGNAFAKTGEAALKVARTDFSSRFLKAKGDAKELDNILQSLAIGIPYPKFGSFYTELDKIVNESKKLGRTFDEEKNLIRAALQAEIDAINKAAAAEAAAETRRLERRKKREADKAKEIQDATDEQQARFPTVEAAFTKASPTTGLAKDFTIPVTVRPEQFNNINSALQAVNAHLIQAKINDEIFNKTLRETRQQLASPTKTFFANVHPDIEKLRQLIVNVHTEMNKVGRGAADAGNAILISWRGVFRLFQAQVLHTAIGQIIAEFRQAIFEVGNFQREVALIQTITQDLFNAGDPKGRAENFREWSETVRELAAELGKTPTEVATAAYDALSNQVVKTREETERFVRVAGNLGRTTATSTADSVNLLSSVIQSFGNEAGTSEEIAAKLFRIIDLGRVKGNELANTFGRTTSLGRSLGASFDDIGAGLITITLLGVKSSEAQTELNNIFIKLLKPTEATKKLFDDYGVSTGPEFIKVTGGIGGALQTIAQAAAQGKGDFTEFFNEIRGAKGFEAIAVGGADKFKQSLNELKKAASNVDLINNAKKVISEPAGVEFLRQINELKIIVTEDIGGNLAGQILKISNQFGGLGKVGKTSVEGITFVFATLEKTIGQVVAVLTGLSNTIGGTSTAFIIGFSSTVVAARTLIVTLGEVRLAAIAAFATTPLGLVTIAASAAVAMNSLITASDRAEEALRRDFEENDKNARQTANTFKDTFNEMYNAVTNRNRQFFADQETGFIKLIASAKKVKTAAVNEFREMADEAKLAFAVSFDSASNRTKELISDLKRQEDEQKSIQESLADRSRGLVEDVERKSFEQRVKTAPPQDQNAITFQRVNDLFTKAQALYSQPIFNTKNINEANKDFDEALQLLFKMSDEYVEINKKTIKFDRNNLVKQITQSAKPAPVNQAYERAYEQYKQAQNTYGTGSDEVREKALRNLNAVHATINQQPSIGGDTVRQLLEINDLRQKAYASGLSQAEVQKIINQYLEKAVDLNRQVAVRAQENQAITERNRRTIQANLDEQSKRYQKLNAIRFEGEGGKELSKDKLVENFKEAEKLVRQIDEGMVQVAEVQSNIPGQTVDQAALFRERSDFLKNSSEYLARIAQGLDLKEQVNQLDHVKNQYKETYVEAGSKYIGDVNKQIQAQNDLLLETDARAKNLAKSLADVAAVRSQDINPLRNAFAATGALGGLLPASQQLDPNSKYNLIESIRKAASGQYLPFKPESYDVEQELRPKVAEHFAASRDAVFKGDTRGAVDQMELALATLNKLDAARKDTAYSQIQVNGYTAEGTIEETTYRKAIEAELGILKQRNSALENRNRLINIQQGTEQLRALPSDFSIRTGPDIGLSTITDNVTKQQHIIADAYLKILMDKRKVEQEYSKIPQVPQIPTPQETNKQFEQVPSGQEGIRRFQLKPINDEINEELNKLNQVPAAIEGQKGAFLNLEESAVGAIGQIISSINQMNNALANSKTPQSKIKAAWRGGYLANGGFVPVMTTPGEVFIAPGLASKYASQLMAANTAFTPQGTDTQPGLFPGGTFVLNKAASQKYFGNTKSMFINNEQHLRRAFFNTGGFIPTYSVSQPTYNPNTYNQQRSLNIVNNISVSNKSGEVNAQQIAKAITRQVNLGITRLG